MRITKQVQSGSFQLGAKMEAPSKMRSLFYSKLTMYGNRLPTPTASRHHCPGLAPHRRGAKASEGGTYRRPKATGVGLHSEAYMEKFYNTNRICPKMAVSSEVIPARPSILICLRGRQETRSALEDMEKFYDTINTQAARPRPRPPRKVWNSRISILI